MKLHLMLTNFCNNISTSKYSFWYKLLQLVVCSENRNDLNISRYSNCWLKRPELGVNFICE